MVPGSGHCGIPAALSEADKVRRLGEEGARPHRVRYKALK